MISGYRNFLGLDSSLRKRSEEHVLNSYLGKKMERRTGLNESTVYYKDFINLFAVSFLLAGHM